MWACLKSMKSLKYMDIFEKVSVCMFSWGVRREHTHSIRFSELSLLRTKTPEFQAWVNPFCETSCESFASWGLSFLEWKQNPSTSQRPQSQVVNTVRGGMSSPGHPIWAGWAVLPLWEPMTEGCARVRRAVALCERFRCGSSGS